MRSIFAAQAAVDEPQYLLTALSLWEDSDLDISDELADRRWREFADVPPPTQTSVLPGGRQISPHDPLLPLLLAAPMGLGGWLAAKLTLAGAAGLLAALTLWVAVRRLALPLPLSTAGVAAAAASAPLAVYGQQVYPELPAALAVAVAVAAATGRRGGRELAVVAVAVTALPWLAVKYAPVGAALAAVVLAQLWRDGRRRSALTLSGVLALSAALYLVVHRLVWGGWTVYASGDHFETTGEFTVVGVNPDYAGRALRLFGLLLDSSYGLVAWAPAWLLLVPALVSIARRPKLPRLLLLGPLAAGWLVATFVALTMHGYWWPGRQVVVVLPLAVLVILTELEPAGRLERWLAAAAGVVSVASYVALLAAGHGGRATWVAGFAAVTDPVGAPLRAALPDYRSYPDGLLARHAVWLTVLIALAAWRWSGRVLRPGRPARTARTAAAVLAGLLAVGGTTAALASGWRDDGAGVRNTSPSAVPAYSVRTDD